jgi:hypothetical protein
VAAPDPLAGRVREEPADRGGLRVVDDDVVVLALPRVGEAPAGPPERLPCPVVERDGRVAEEY